MRIGDRQIGTGEPVYIIAEIGVNHDGDVEKALMLADAAADAGADAIKLQYFKTDLLMSRAAKLAAYQLAAGETDPIEMLRRLELSLGEMSRVVERAHERGIHAIVTVFSTELVEPAMGLAWDAVKSASPDIIHRPLLEALKATGKPMIVSTGASTLEEVRRAVGWLEPARERLAVLQCVSCYPAEDMALGGIAALADASGLVVGYSDHAVHADSGALAVSDGARLLEKHLTHDTGGAGPDHAASLDPGAFGRYVGLARGVREPGARAGSAEKVVLDCERDVRGASRQSIVLRGPGRGGQRLALDDLAVKRPGTGIEPFMLGEIIGCRLARDVEGDVPLTWEDLEAGDSVG